MRSLNVENHRSSGKELAGTRSSSLPSPRLRGEGSGVRGGLCPGARPVAWPVALSFSCVFLTALAGCKRPIAAPATPAATSAEPVASAALVEAPAVAPAQPGAADLTNPADWPMFRGNPQLTGVAEGTLPAKLTVLWTYDAGGPNEAIESSAAIVGNRVYVGSSGGALHALALDSGKPAWKFTPANAGVKSSPTVAAGTVYFGDDSGVFHAVDADTGTERWTYQTDSEIVSSASVAGDRVLFGSYDESLYCLSRDDGKLLWRFKTQGYVHCTPAVAEGKTFISGCDGQLRVLDITDGKEIAAIDMESQTGASPAVRGDWLYVGHFGNQVLGIQWKKREIAWRYENADRPFPFYSSPALANQRVILGSRDKIVHALDAATGIEQWAFPTKGRVDSSPVVVADRVYVGSHDGNVYGLALATGEELWRFATGAPVSASPAVAAGRLVIGNEDGKLFCFGEKR